MRRQHARAARARAGADRDRPGRIRSRRLRPTTAMTPSTSERSSIVDLGAQLVEIELLSTRVGASARGQSRKKPPPSSAGASATMQSTMILPCGVSSAAKRAAAGRELGRHRWSASPLRKVRASAPATLTTPRSGRSAAFMRSVRFPISTCQSCRRNVRRADAALKAAIRGGRQAFQYGGWLRPDPQGRHGRQPGRRGRARSRRPAARSPRSATVGGRAAETVDCRGPAYPAGRDRHPGAFPRARA